MKTKIFIFTLFFLASFVLEAKPDSSLILDKEAARDMLAETEDFSVSCPSDWKEELKAEILTLKGPLLPDSKRPFIAIRQEKDEAAIRSMEKTKEVYYRWKDLPAFKGQMLKFIMPIFETIYGVDRYKFVSCDYGENGDFITQRLVSLDKARNMKVCDTSFITKARPTRGYSLIFFCPEEHYDEYFPVFEKCLASFSVKE